MTDATKNITISEAVQTATDMATDAVNAADAINNLGVYGDYEAEQKKLTTAVCDMTAEVRKLYSLGSGNLHDSIKVMQDDLNAWRKAWSNGVPITPPNPQWLNPVLPHYIYPPNCENQNG